MYLARKAGLTLQEYETRLGLRQTVSDIEDTLEQRLIEHFRNKNWD